jgi:hypothetical protein
MALKLYFELPNVLLKHEIVPLVIKLPAATAYERLKKELRNTDWMSRQAAVKAIGNMPFPDKNQLIDPLLNDPDKQVRKRASLFRPEWRWKRSHDCTIRRHWPVLTPWSGGPELTRQRHAICSLLPQRPPRRDGEHNRAQKERFDALPLAALWKRRE